MKAAALPFNAFFNGITARHVLLLSAAMLSCIGLVMVASASMGVAEAMYGDAFYFLRRHLLFLVTGVLVAIAFVRVPMEIWERHSGKLLVLAALMLGAVLISGIGHAVNGSRRWINLGFMTFQPSELGKLAMVAYVAAYLVRHLEQVRTSYLGFMKPMMVVVLIVGLLLAEPDFGASMVITCTVLIMLFLAGARLLPYLGMVAVVLSLATYVLMMEDYRRERLLAFTNPWANPFDSGYQLVQSLIAFGRGDWFGVGLGRGVQKLFYLPEAHTDFVFAVYAEETGLIGVLVMLALFLALVFAGLAIGRTAELAGQHFAAYAAYGLSCLLGLQAVVNLCVNMGLFPTKGLTLPLVSYGGTSLVVVFIMLALLLRIDIENTLVGGRHAR